MPGSILAITSMICGYPRRVGIETWNFQHRLPSVTGQLLLSLPFLSQSMKARPALALVTMVLVGSLAGFYLYDRFNVGSTSSCSDPASISSHVYHPYRLQIVKSCITASGTVDRVIEEADGDVHVRTILDQAYVNLTNSANDQYQYGDLVVEIICVNPPSQMDAIPACQDYTNQIPDPSAGQHITITGPYVLDTDHYNWAEIHPVYSLVIG